MTVCNMSIEAGARAGMIAPDETTFEYLEGRPVRAEGEDWERALDDVAPLRTDDGATFDREVVDRRRRARAAGDLGHEPRRWSRRSTASSPTPPLSTATQRERSSARSRYMGLDAGHADRDIEIDAVFIGSCTNARIEDLRAAAQVVAGRKVADGVRAMVRAGLGAGQARRPRTRGSTRSSCDAGFEWREPGCSMCLGMNPDVLAAGRAVRLDVEPQLRGPAGSGRAHAPGEPRDGGRGGDRGHFADVRELRVRTLPIGRRTGGGARPRRRRHRSDHSEAVPEAHRAPGLRRLSSTGDARTRDFVLNDRLRRAPRSCSRAATSAAARRASTPSGRSTTTASAP